MKAWAGWLGATLLLSAAPVAATVYEIGTDGAVVVMDMPVLPDPPPIYRRPKSATRSSFAPTVEAAAARYALSTALIDAIARTESAYRPHAVSSRQAMGIMQLMPKTAAALGVDARDPTANIHGGSAYVRQLLDRFDGDIIRTIAAYNAGPGAVERAHGVPRYPETVRYVAQVLDLLAQGAQ